MKSFFFQALKRRIDFLFFRKKHPNLLFSDKKIIYNNIIDRGEGNKIIIGKNSLLQNCSITFNGAKCTLEIKDNVRLWNVSFWFEDVEGMISVGSNTTMEKGCQFASVEGAKIVIGEDCMFSHDIDLRTSDSHSVINMKGERINPSKDIKIGNHVWLGIRSTILKGSEIGNNCVVSACSLVTSKTNWKSNCIIGGVPAKILKNDINWKRERI